MKTNRGWFRKGYDPRRLLLTKAHRQLGYQNAPSRIKSRIRMLYKKGRIPKVGETVYTELEDYREEG